MYDFCLQLCKMYEDYLEDLFKYSLKLLLGRKKKNDESTKQENTEKEEKNENSEETCTADADKVEDNKSENYEQETDSENRITEVSNNDSEVAAEGESASVQAVDVPASSSGEASVAQQEEKADKGSQYSFSELHFSFTALLLWLCVTLLNVPCVLVWAHKYK